MRVYISNNTFSLFLLLNGGVHQHEHDSHPRFEIKTIRKKEKSNVIYNISLMGVTWISLLLLDLRCKLSLSPYEFPFPDAFFPSLNP